MASQDPAPAHSPPSSTVSLHIIGSGDAFASEGRNYTSYLLEYGGKRVLLDCGPTTLPALKKLGLNSFSLDALIISHLHGDHIGGVPFMFLERCYPQDKLVEERDLLILGPFGLEARLRALYALLYEDAIQTIPKITFHAQSLTTPEVAQRFEMKNEVGEVNHLVQIPALGLSVEPFPVSHEKGRQSFAVKLRFLAEGKTLLYSGDAAWHPEFPQWAADADIFLCECCTTDGNRANHISLAQITANYPKAARPAGQRLILTHLGPSMRQLPHPTTEILAEDGATFTL